MLQSRSDLQEKLVAGLDGQSDELPKEVAEMLDPFEYVASANYVVPMLLDLAIDRGNGIVDAVPRYSSMDHAANWSGLLSAMSRFEGFMMPYFERKLAPDPFAEELLRHEQERLWRHHAAASFKQGLWHLMEDEDGLRVNLAPRARRSALHLVANKADFLLSPPQVQALLRELDPGEGTEDFILATGTHALAILRESCPDAWGKLESGLPFRIDLVSFFRAFVIRLAESGVRWGRKESLWPAWGEFAEERGAPSMDRAEFDALVDFHTLTPAEGLRWSLQAPIIRFEHAIAIWPFVFHVLHPDLNFLTLLVRRHDALWSRTLGADLALVADRMAARAPKDGRFSVRARRRRKGVGEIDLAVLDRKTGDVLVLELKAVFDKFRTHVQLSNFVDQRVNFSKAIGQARTAAEAIRQGDWKLRDLFGDSAPSVPRSVTPGLLTWWDTFNPTLDGEDPILCCNFVTFEYLLSEADSLADLVQALEELSRLYCLGTLHKGVAMIGGEKMELRREKQDDALPPFDLSQLGPLTRKVLSDVRRAVVMPETGPDPAAPVPFAY